MLNVYHVCTRMCVRDRTWIRACVNPAVIFIPVISWLDICTRAQTYTSMRSMRATNIWTLGDAWAECEHVCVFACIEKCIRLNVTVTVACTWHASARSPQTPTPVMRLLAEARCHPSYTHARAASEPAVGGQDHRDQSNKYSSCVTFII